jgi:predicted DNA-binding protein (MmcQ/YjbR family)
LITIDKVKELALAFEEAVEQPHFHKSSFRVKKKIFATLDTEKQQVVLKFTEVDQSVFSAHDNSIIYPVPGAWGKQGWTIVELQKVNEDLFKDALTTSYCTVAPKKLGDQYKPNEID